MLKNGIIRPSNSQWATPLVPVKEEGKKLRIVGDYRRLNVRTSVERYPIPNIQDSTQMLHGKKMFSVVDLVRAYHNIPVFPQHVHKTAVITPIGLFEYTRMPFGLRNAGATYQRFMNSILFDLPFVFCYIDDVLIFSDSPEEHRVLARFQKYGLSINMQKSKFFVTEVNFLGYKISQHGMIPLPERIEFIRSMEKPKTITELRRTLGILNYYRRFTRVAAKYLAPLNEVLRGHTRKKDRTQIKCTPELEEAFEEARKAFIEYTLLHFPKEGAQLMLTCGAPGKHILRSTRAIK